MRKQGAELHYEHHLVIFLNKTRIPLGVLAEQSSESVHRTILKNSWRASKKGGNKYSSNRIKMALIHINQ